MIRKARSICQRRKGAVMVLAAFIMTVMIGMIAFAIDVGRITLAREQLQVAADAAAMAGADTLVNGTAAAIAAAQQFAQSNSAGRAMVVIVPSQDIQLGTWSKTALTFTPLSGAAQSNANAVRVTCVMSQARGNPLNLFFAPILSTKSVNITAQATCLSSSLVCGPFVGLNSVTLSGGSHTDSYDSSEGSYSALAAGSLGNVCSNGTITLSAGSVVKGNAHPGTAGTVKIAAGSSVTGSTTPLTQALSEPAVNVGSAATVNNNANIPLSARGKQPLSKAGAFSLTTADSLTLPPGTYYFASLTVSGGSTLKITGTTVIYVTGNVKLSAGTVNNASSLPINCQIYCLGTTVTLPTAAPFYGTIYAPTAAITDSGTADCFGMLVGASLKLSGGAGFHYDQSLASLTGGQQTAQLVQ